MAVERHPTTVAAPRPRPVVVEHTRPFWQAAADGELRLPRCEACAAFYYPPPPRCPRCLGTKMSWPRLSGQGRVRGFTRVHLATIPGIVPPFTMLEVELAEHAGLIVCALLDQYAAAEPDIGCAVEVAFSSADDGWTFPYWRLAGLGT